MVQATPLVAGSLFFLATMVGASTAAELKFSCKGQVIQEMTDRLFGKNQSISA